MLELAGPSHDPAGAAEHHHQTGRQGDEPRDGEKEEEVWHPDVAPAARSAGPGAQALEERGADLEQVADHEQVGELGDGRIDVSIDRHDRV